MDITGAIGSVTAAIGLARELRAIDADFAKAELKMKIAELTEALADAKLALGDVSDQLRSKDEAIAELTEKLRYRSAETVDMGHYRYRAEDGQPFGLPLCPVCETKGEFITIIQDRSKGISYRCPKCKSDYGAHLRSYSRTSENPNA